ENEGALPFPKLPAEEQERRHAAPARDENRRAAGARREPDAQRADEVQLLPFGLRCERFRAPSHDRIVDADRADLPAFHEAFQAVGPTEQGLGFKRDAQVDELPWLGPRESSRHLEREEEISRGDLAVLHDRARYEVHREGPMVGVEVVSAGSGPDVAREVSASAGLETAGGKGGPFPPAWARRGPGGWWRAEWR